MFLDDFKLLAAPYWRSPDRASAWLTLALAILALLGIIAIHVRWNDWNLGFYNALQALNAQAFGYHVAELFVLDLAFVACTTYKFYLQQKLSISWRQRLTDAFLAKWLAQQRYYRSRFYPVGYDNPDQRIAEDCQLFVEQTLELGLALFKALLLFALFVGIMWRISGPLEFTLAGHQVVIPSYMLWLALTYALAATLLTEHFGKVLVGLSFEQQRREADFRFNLVRLREQAENVALTGSAGWEHARLSDRLGAVLANYWQLVRRKKLLLGINAGYERFSFTLPLLLVAPRFFSREITLGQLTQTASAFGEIQDSLSFLIKSYPEIAKWRATKQRLCDFWRELDALPAPPEPHAGAAAGLALDAFAPLDAHSHPLFAPLTLTLAPGERLLLRGPSGIGKTTLLRALVGLWPRHQGHARLDRADLMILPQRPHLPPASLRELLYLPEAPRHDEERHDAARLAAALELAGLSALELDRVDDWSQRLSPGEQQRFALARALFQRPALLLLDEASSGLDAAAERRLYQALADSGITVVSIGHREQLAAWHHHVIDLEPTARPTAPAIATDFTHATASSNAPTAQTS